MVEEHALISEVVTKLLEDVPGGLASVYLREQVVLLCSLLLQVVEVKEVVGSFEGVEDLEEELIPASQYSLMIL